MANNKSKLLYITNYPMDSSASAAIRNRAIVEGFYQCEYDIYTLTRRPNIKSNNNNIKEYYFDNKSVAYSIANKVKRDNNNLLWKIRVNVAKIISKLNIYDNQRVLLKNIEKIQLDITDFDIIVSSSDSKVSHLIADILISKGIIKTSKWIQYWGDPFYSDINEKPIIPSKIIFKEEERLLSKGDYIFYTSPFTLKQQKELFAKSSGKMFFIPTPYIEPRLYKSTKNTTYTVGYYGSYFRKDRDLIPLYNVAKNLKNINFEFIGSTDLNFEENDNVLVKSQIPNNEILEHEEKCDLLICVGNKSASYQIPGKLYHFAATNKPVIYIYEKESKEMAYFFNKYSRYYFCENNIKDIEEIIKEIIESPTIEALPVVDFHCKNVASEILKLING